MAEYDVEDSAKRKKGVTKSRWEGVLNHLLSHPRVKAEFARVIFNIAVQYEKNKSSGVGGGVRSPTKRMVAATRQ